MTSELYPEYTQGKLDPQVERFLHQMVKANMPPMSEVTPEQARAGMKMRKPMGDPIPVEKVENLKVPGPAGDIPIRVYTPEGDGPFPILVYFHAGGFVGHYADNRGGQEYDYFPEPKNPIERIRWSKANRQWQQGKYMRFLMADKPYKHYDYNF